MYNNQNITAYASNSSYLHGASIVAMQQDCSGKRHYRANLSDGASYVIMDASEVPGVADAFIKVSNLLLQNECSAPKILEYDERRQILLTEDFGHNSYKNVLEKDRALEMDLYKLAAKVLAKVYQIDAVKDLPIQDFQTLNQALSFSFINRYARLHLAEDQLKAAEYDLLSVFNDFYTKMRHIKKSIILKDYHIDNLMLLNNREDYKKVGLLDIQDASMGLAAYDLVSLLEDARRDVSEDTVKAVQGYFFELTPSLNREEFEYTYAVLGMQRSMRILGLFTYLSQQPGKEHYGQFIPRVSYYIKNWLNNAIFDGLLYWSDKYKISLYGESH